MLHNPYRFYVASPDPYWADVRLLIHCNGTNGSTAFPDSGPSNRAVSSLGNAQVSTTAPKFGTGSASFDGTGDYLSVAQTGMVLGASDFTIEFWFKTTIYCTLFYKGVGSTGAENDYYAWVHPTNGLSFSYRTLGAGNIQESTTGFVTSTDGNWHHFAVTRSGGTMRLFRDGVLRATDATLGTAAINNNNVNLSFGGPGTNLAVPDFSGNMDEIRITLGVARYTSTFTPATAPFPGNTDPLDYRWAIMEQAGSPVMLALSGSNATITSTSNEDGISGTCRTVTAVTGKKYIEILSTNYQRPTAFGVTTVTNNTAFYNAGAWCMFRGNGGCGLATSGYYVNGAGTSSTSYLFVDGDLIGIAFDADTGKLWFRKNGAWISGDPAAGTGETMTVAAGTRYFYYGTYTCFTDGAYTSTIRSRASEQTYGAPIGFSPYDSGNE